MCELLGLTFNVPVAPKISFTGFRIGADENPHGWGLAFYPDRSVQIFKEPIQAEESQLASFIAQYAELRSKIFVGHVRLKSAGEACHQNTHPFSREVDGIEYVFAHNGTLSGYTNLTLSGFHPIGSTDSEHAFCHLLGCMKERGISELRPDDLEWLDTQLRGLNNLGTLNCILSDGNTMVCYHDRSGYRELCLLHRISPYGIVKMRDQDVQINLAEEKDPNQSGYIIATNPLTNEKWQRFRPGELRAFKDGQMIYSNLRDAGDEASSGLSRTEVSILRYLRSELHKVSVDKIVKSLGDSEHEILSAIVALHNEGYLKQDTRTHVPPTDKRAEFYTNPIRKNEIDIILDTTKR